MPGLGDGGGPPVRTAKLSRAEPPAITLPRLAPEGKSWHVQNHVQKVPFPPPHPARDIRDSLRLCGTAETVSVDVDQAVELVPGGILPAEWDMRFGWRNRICRAPAPHVDGDPFWGLVRSRRRGPLPGARKALPELFGHCDGRRRRPTSPFSVEPLPADAGWSNLRTMVRITPSRIVSWRRG